MFSENIENLAKLFARLPGIGKKTALRFVFYLASQNKEKTQELIQALQDLKEKTKFCAWCNKAFSGTDELCAVCADPRRDKTLVCVVEKEVDLEAIEETLKYKGLYFILGGLLSFKKDALKQELQEQIEKLKKIIKENNVKEVILALNPTIEGKNTILWLKRELEPLQTKTTLLGVGLPVGGEMEYADAETLSSALQSRA